MGTDQEDMQHSSFDKGKQMPASRFCPGTHAIESFYDNFIPGFGDVEEHVRF